MLHDLADQLSRHVQDALNKSQNAADLSQSKLKEIVQMALRKCDLVSREEFDAQSAVLEKTRAKLHALEEQLEELQKNLNTPD